MLTLTATRGLPGSGKSTWAKEQNAVRANRDDLRKMMYGKYWGLSYDQEETITKVQRAVAAEALNAGTDVVVDDTNLRPKYLKDWNTFAIQHGALFRTIEFPVDIDVCKRRDRMREERTVGARVIENMAAKYMPKGRFLPYTIIQNDPELLGKFGFEGRVVVPYLNPRSLPHVVIVDIDGTMALMGDRSPYDWKAVSHDKPNWPVVNLVCDLLTRSETVIFLSGRDGSCREETLQWLRRYLPRGYDSRWFLFMREAGDNRKDNIVKNEIFDREIRDRFHVKFVLDDRDQVVRMWRALGLSCFQVAEGDF